MLRTVLAAIAGVVMAWLTITLFEFVSASLHPPPAGLDVADVGAMQAYVASMPVQALGLVTLGWIVAALDGGVVAGLVDRSPRGRIAAGLVGVLVVLGVLAVSRMIPHPTWMSAIGLLLPVPAALFGAWLVRKRVARAA